MQVKQFSCKSVEMSLRVASLDYLGIVAARLRRDAVSSRLNEDIISDVIKQVCMMQQAFTCEYFSCELYIVVTQLSNVVQ